MKTDTIFGEDDILWLDGDDTLGSDSRHPDKQRLKEKASEIYRMKTEAEVIEIDNELRIAIEVITAKLNEFYIKCRSQPVSQDEIDWCLKAHLARAHYSNYQKETRRKLDEFERDAARGISEERAARFAVQAESIKNARLKAARQILKDMSWERQFVNVCREMIPFETFEAMREIVDKRMEENAFRLGD